MEHTRLYCKAVAFAAFEIEWSLSSIQIDAEVY